jgi:hypothetical protein
MSSRLLDFQSYIGGSDNVQVINLFPRSQKTFTYDFNADVSLWNFTADKQSLVLDQITYDRVSKLPNFADSIITGYMNSSTTIPAGTYISETNAALGQIDFTIPAERYTGPLLPNARQNPVMTVVSFEWQTGDTPPQYESHRWAIIETWEPGVTVGDPQLHSTFVPIGVGAIATFSDNSSTDSSRAAGTYTVSGLPNAGTTGASQSFSITVNDSGVTTIDILARGTGFQVGDTIDILDKDLGAGGGADITVTVSTVA